MRYYTVDNALIGPVNRKQAKVILVTAKRRNYKVYISENYLAVTTV